MRVRPSLLRRSATASVMFAAMLSVVSAPALLAQTPSAAIAAMRPAAQQDRILAHPNFAPLTQLSHQLPGWVQSRPQSSAHAVDLSTTIGVSLVLNRDPAVEAAFDKFLADQQTPGSPLYRQWLTPQQVGSLFGPTASDLAALTSWLTSQGLKVDSIAPSGVILHASGSAAVLGNAFHTSFAMFSADEGLTAAPRLSAVSEPLIPTALTPLIRSIQGLGETVVTPLSVARPMEGAVRPAGSPSGVQPLYTNGTDHYLTPGDMAVIFDINGVYNGGNTGATIGSAVQRIAVIGESRVVGTDITEFENLTGIASYVPAVVIPAGAVDPGTTASGLQSEATLDVDRVLSTATGAGVDLVIAKDSATEGGIFLAMQWNVSNLLDPIMTISFGGCESQNGQANTNFIDNIAKTGAAEGITTIVSSGDSGAAGCDLSFTKAPAAQVASINFLCSSTYVTCVGGTQFNDVANPASYWNPSNGTALVSAISYIPEGGWNEPSSTAPKTGIVSYAPAASGGGVSLYIPKPSWQTGTGVPSGSFRFVPDISLPASGHDGYFACLAFNGGDCNNKRFEVFSGTSAAAPGIAGIVALINTKLGTAVGNLNPLLYQLASSHPTAFHDTTVASSGVTGCAVTTPSMCNNSTPGPTTLTGGLSGFLLTAGYDAVTGLGSPDVAVLVGNASVVDTTLVATTLAVTPPAAITAGQSTTFTATLTPAAGSTGNPTGTVQFYSNGTGLGAAATLTGNVATSPLATFPTAGTYSITAVYSGDTAFAASTSASVPLTVNAAPAGSFTLTPTPGTLAITRGATSSNIISIAGTSTNAFVGTVSLSCSISNSSGGSGLNPPTCNPTTASLPLTANGTGTASFAIVSTPSAPGSSCSAGATPRISQTTSPWLGGSTGIVIAGLLLLVPLRKRRAFRSLAMLSFLVLALTTISGCGGGGSKPCPVVPVSGTSPGTYTVTITGTSSSITKTTTVALTIN